MMPTFVASKRGYEKMWSAATVLPSYRAKALAAARKIIGLRSFYLDAEKATGAPWWWIGCVHYREGDCAPHACLANGDPAVGTGRRTVNVPAGRGPYHTFAESAVDALRYEGLLGRVQVSVPWCLWAAEKINGFVAAHNSNYIWAGTTKMQRGMWVRDHQFDPTVNDPRPGVAAIMKELFAIDHTLEPAQGARPAIVAAGLASAPVVVASTASGDPSFTIGAALAVVVIMAIWAAQTGKGTAMSSLLVNWKTTLAGIGVLASAIGTLASGAASGHLDGNVIGQALAAIFAASGLFAAKDFNVTGGTTQR